MELKIAVNEKKEITRRQFLNYTLLGVGGFLAAGMLTPMVRMAADPVTKMTTKGPMVATGFNVAQLTDKPQRVDFTVKIQDGWYESEEAKTAWVYRNSKEEIVALSPKCTHLGCTVDWNTNPDYPDHFICPCHGGRYEISGKNIPGTPPPEPLHTFEYTVNDGILYLGELTANPI